MKIVEIAETPGVPGCLSEDRVGISGNIAWVIDGASDFRNERNLPAVSNVHWLADRVQEEIGISGVDGSVSSATLLLSAIQERIKQELSEFNLREMQQHPCCSLSLIIEDGRRIEISRIGDAVGFLYGKSATQLIATDYFDRREAAAVAAAKAERLTRDQVTAAMYERRAEYIFGINEESVFSGHPAGNLFVRTFVTQKGAGFQSALICTDGLARAVSEYRMFDDWRGMFETASERGLAWLIDEIRQHEHSSRSANQAKFKKSDDIAAIIVDF
jgi:hypothetical protein